MNLSSWKLFPKCGRTWLRYIFLHLYDQHLAAEHFVDLANTRLKIVLVRNILDAMVSYYFEVKHRAGFVGDADRKNELLDRWCKSDRSMRSFVRFGVADDFLNFYDECARLTGERILVRYEDLQSDTVGTVTRIATRLAPVLGRELSASAIERHQRLQFRIDESAGNLWSGHFWEFNTWAPGYPKCPPGL